MINGKDVVAFRVRTKYFVFYNEVCKRKMSVRLSTDFSSLKHLRCAQVLYSRIFYGTRKLKDTCLCGKYHDRDNYDNLRLTSTIEYYVKCNFNRNTCTQGKHYNKNKIMENSRVLDYECEQQFYP